MRHRIKDDVKLYIVAGMIKTTVCSVQLNVMAA